MTKNKIHDYTLLASMAAAGITDIALDAAAIKNGKVTKGIVVGKLALYAYTGAFLLVNGKELSKRVNKRIDNYRKSKEEN